MDTEGLEHPEKWAVETFGTAELGDLRRTDRLVKMATAIAENPSASLPESMRNWADTLASYRFLDNEAVTHEQIMLPHWISTHQEAVQHSRVLLPADTTNINLSSHGTAEGLGPIGRGKKAQGFARPHGAGDGCRLTAVERRVCIKNPLSVKPHQKGRPRPSAKSACESRRSGSGASRRSGQFQRSSNGSTWGIGGAISTPSSKPVNNWDMTLSCAWLKIVGSCSMKCLSQRTPRYNVSKLWLVLCSLRVVGSCLFPPNVSALLVMLLYRSVGKKCVSNHL